MYVILQPTNYVPMFSFNILNVDFRKNLNVLEQKRDTNIHVIVSSLIYYK